MRQDWGCFAKAKARQVSSCDSAQEFTGMALGAALEAAGRLQLLDAMNIGGGNTRHLEVEKHFPKFHAESEWNMLKLLLLLPLLSLIFSALESV